MSTTKPSNGSEAGPFRTLLERLAGRLGVHAIDRVWLFPEHQGDDVGSHVAVVSVIDGEKNRRRLFTVQHVARRNGAGDETLRAAVTEHATLPANRIGRVLEGVVHRLDHDTAAPPRSYDIAGSAERWGELLGGIG